MNTKRIFALILAVSMILCLLSCTKKDGGKEDGDRSEDHEGIPAVWSDTTVITQDMYVYYFNGYYRYFLETYSASLESLGLDPAQALSAQQQSEQYTWQQYMTLQVYTQLREMIALADAAKADGIELDDEDIKEIESQISAYDSLAEEAGMTVEDYIEKIYGSGVTKDVMKAAITVRFLANRYYTKLVESYTFTDEECLEYYNANSKSFVHFDYLKITVPAEDAEQLTACEDAESFIDAMRSIITKNNFIGDYDRFADSIEAQVKKKQYLRADFDSNSDFCKWVVEEDRQPYDIHTKTESTGDITVAMILPTNDPGAINEVVYRDDVPLKNIKYIVFEDSEGTEGKVKAESIYKNWQEEPTEERFDELVAEYNGGTAESVARGEFNDDVNEWVFSEERKAGDVDIVATEGGAYLLYMLEDGEPSWIFDVRDVLADEKYADDMEKLIDDHPTEYDSDFIYNVMEVKVTETTANTTEAQ